MLLFGTDLWPALEIAWRVGPRKCAVAYWTDGSLFFAEGDTLVVDASDAAIASGQTKASALRAAVEAGAYVFSWPGLHAKVYVLGAVAFIGSANASLASRSLMEGALRTADPQTVGEAMRFVSSVAAGGDAVNDAFLRRIEAIPAEQRRGGAPSTKLAQSRPQRWWLVGLVPLPEHLDDARYENDNAALQNTVGDGAIAEYLRWGNKGYKFHADVAEGDLIVALWRPKAGKTNTRLIRIFPPSVVWKSYLDDDGVRICHHVSRADQDDLSLSWTRFQRLIKEAGWDVTPSFSGARELPRAFAERINRLWPGLFD